MWGVGGGRCWGTFCHFVGSGPRLHSLTSWCCCLYLSICWALNSETYLYLHKGNVPVLMKYAFIISTCGNVSAVVEFTPRKPASAASAEFYKTPVNYSSVFLVTFFIWNHKKHACNSPLVSSTKLFQFKMRVLTGVQMFLQYLIGEKWNYMLTSCWLCLLYPPPAYISLPFLSSIPLLNISIAYSFSEHFSWPYCKRCSIFTSQM